jgi:hypothetical protein
VIGGEIVLLIGGGVGGCLLVGSCRFDRFVTSLAIAMDEDLQFHLGLVQERFKVNIIEDMSSGGTDVDKSRMLWTRQKCRGECSCRRRYEKDTNVGDHDQDER